MVFVVFICISLIISEAEWLLMFIGHFSPVCNLLPIILLHCCSLINLQVFTSFTYWHFADYLWCKYLLSVHGLFSNLAQSIFSSFSFQFTLPSGFPNWTY